MSVLTTVAISLGAGQLLAEAFRIPSGSMEPNMLVGDWLFVNKLRYGGHIPFTRLVKRIVGVESDTLLMRGGQLTVNGTVVPSPNACRLPDAVADVHRTAPVV